MPKILEHTARLLPLSEKTNSEANSDGKTIAMCDALCGQAEHAAAEKFFAQISDDQVTPLGKKPGCCAK